jgi:hypothetical protein
MIMAKHLYTWLAFIIALGSFMFVHPGVLAQSVVQSYGASTNLEVGLMVELQPGNSSDVEALTQANATKMFGVVVNPNTAAVSLSTSSSPHITYVATTGNYQVLVDNENGSIHVGDYITISSIDGVGMKAVASDQIVLGKALSNFAGTTDSLGSTIIKNSNGQTSTVQLGLVDVSINVAHNPLLQNTRPDLPNFLLNAGQTVANKPVSESRIYISLVIIGISAVIAGSMLYAGIRSSIISIGRNPLSRRSITRSLIQVTLTSLIVFILGLFAVYLLLRV